MARRNQRSRQRGKQKDDSPAVSSQQGPPTPHVTLSYSEFHHLVETKNTIIPSAEELERLNFVVENGAERLFAMVEKQQEHRHSLEGRALDSDIRSRDQTRWIGSILGLVVIGAGAYLIDGGHDYAGASLVIGTLGTVLAAFIVNKTNILVELAEKRRRMLGLSRDDE